MNHRGGCRFAWLSFEILLGSLLLFLFLDVGLDGRSTASAAVLPGGALLQGPGTADLTVSKSGSPGTVVTGNNITYTINFSNGGPDAATTVMVQDPVPAGTTFVSASVTSGAGWSISAPAVGGTGTVTFSKASVANGETAVFSIVVKAASAMGISNTVAATSAATDPNPGNSTSTASTAVAAFDLCIQDDATRATLTINATTGAFQFSDCGKGVTFSGVGVATRDPSLCKIFFSSQANKTGAFATSATINLCTMVGTAQVFKPGSTTATKLFDSNISNNSCGCF
ncbi:MAG TPA: DUF11 domain-containing protein [Blastocatellia bacterium]|nr:DUF11 domain-containing protein [Blastocatellia bacterium]